MQELYSPTGNSIFADTPESVDEITTKKIREEKSESTDSGDSSASRRGNAAQDGGTRAKEGDTSAQNGQTNAEDDQTKAADGQTAAQDGRTSARETAEKLPATRMQIASALSRTFGMPITGWQNCASRKCTVDEKGEVVLFFGVPSRRADKFDEVLGHLDKVLSSARIAKVLTKSNDQKGELKYHVVPTDQPPEPLELLAPITMTAIELRNSAATETTSQAPTSSIESSVDNFFESILTAAQKPLMNNLLAAFERKHLLLDHSDLKIDHKDAEYHFDQGVVQLLNGQTVDEQLAFLKSTNGQDGALKCQSKKAEHLARILKLIAGKAALTPEAAKQAGQELLQNLPDDLYRMQALYDLALKAKTDSMPGLSNSDSEKDMLHSMTVIFLLAALACTSPIFAFILFKLLTKKSVNNETPVEKLSAVSYGWKRMTCVLLTLVLSLFLVVGFEYASGFDLAVDTALLAMNYPIPRIMCDLVASTLFNLPVFLVYFVWCIPKGISFAEGFGLRLSTLNYSFKQLCSTGVVAYLSLNAVTASTMVLMVLFHHPDSVTDSSASIATTMSVGAAALMFFVESLFGPVMEELCFRGVLYRGLRASWGIVPSLIVSSLWFAVLHNEFAPWLLFHKFAVGAVNALLYERTKSLVPSIISHCLNNIFLDIA